MSILLTGGTGFIGSHTVIELYEQGYDKIIIVDNLSNSSKAILGKIKEITGKVPIFYECDMRDDKGIDEIFTKHSIDCVIHFAAFKAVGESVKNPFIYYDNNINGMITLLNIMDKHNTRRIIFSSSCTVYGHPKSLPLTEKSDLNILSPYGRTKLMGEQILQDLYNVNSKWEIIILRYFNPVGAHRSGIIGEIPNGTPNNLFPYILDVIKGIKPYLNIYGHDYDTYDGTGVRDYIHVVDLAKGHIKAINKVQPGVQIYNLGTGRGYSVLHIVSKFNQILESNNDSRRVEYKLIERRDGDSHAVYADTALAKECLGWEANLNIDDMVRDSLKFLNNGKI